MAKMYPDDIEDYEDATEGEKQVFKLNKEASRFNNIWTCFS